MSAFRLAYMANSDIQFTKGRLRKLAGFLSVFFSGCSVQQMSIFRIFYHLYEVNFISKRSRAATSSNVGQVKANIGIKTIMTEIGSALSN